MPHVAKLLCLLLLVSLSVEVTAQKIGYVYVNAVFAYMPETQEMEQVLTTYQQKLSEQLSIKRSYAQQKLQEAEQKAQQGASDQELNSMREELLKLDEEIRQAEADAEQQLMDKRQELFGPISQKVSEVIQNIAEKRSYTHVLNAVDSKGSSVVLHGPPEHDLTKEVMTRLGIEIPDPQITNTEGKK